MFLKLNTRKTRAEKTGKQLRREKVERNVNVDAAWTFLLTKTTAVQEKVNAV